MSGAQIGCNAWSNLRDIHDYAGAIAGGKRKVMKYRGGQVACDFLDHLLARGMSEGRVSTYAIKLRTVMKMLDETGVDASTATRTEVEKVMALINQGTYTPVGETPRQYKPTTKAALAITLKMLVKYAQTGRTDREAAYPSAVAWIKPKVKEGETRATPDKLLHEKDFLNLVSHARNPRDRALVYVTYEGAFRPGEVLTMKVGDVQFNEKYLTATAYGKTGQKVIPLVVSMGPLMDWLALHPRKDDPSAPLWFTLSRRDYGRQLSYQYFRLMLKRMARDSGFKGDFWGYLLRHTRLTAMADKLTEIRLDQFAGWKLGSPMASRYVHWSGRDLTPAVLSVYGIKTEEQAKESLLKPQTCPRCKRLGIEVALAPDLKRCPKCGLILDPVLAAKMEAHKMKETEDLRKRIEKLESQYGDLQGRGGRREGPSSPRQGTS